jgi:hypothetical protein
MKAKAFLFLPVLLLMGVATYSQTKKSLTNDDVLQMVKAGFQESMIIKAIEANETNFDVTVECIIDLKNAGVSQPIIEAMLAAETKKRAAPPDTTPHNASPPDPNDPRTPHAPGIYWFSMKPSELRLIRLEPTSYSNTKTGGVFGAAMTGGIHKAKWKAILPGPGAALRVNEPSPEFWFYFDEKPQGFGQSNPLSAQATKPEEFGLAKMDRSGKERLLVVGQASAFGTSTGIRSEDSVPFEVQKIANGVYKVRPSKPLEPGEYCFVPPGGAVGYGMAGGTLFDFGVDRAK